MARFDNKTASGCISLEKKTAKKNQFPPVSGKWGCWPIGREGLYMEGNVLEKRESSGAGGYFERVAVERCGEETSLFTREEKEVLYSSFQK